VADVTVRTVYMTEWIGMNNVIRMNDSINKRLID